MKNFTAISLFTILLFTLFSNVVNAQISLVANDINIRLQLGEKITTYLDTTTLQINVGAPGQSSWDLSGLTASAEFVTESKNVAASPYSSEFTGAQFASNYAGVFSGVYSNSWVYNSLNTNFLTHGTGTVANQPSGNVTTVIKFSPAKIEYKLPLNYNDESTYTGTQTVKTTVTVPIVGEITTTIEQQVEITQKVDGYGVVTFPGGKKLNALRIIEVTKFTYNSQITTSTVIKLITKTGESAAFTPKNQNQLTGLISVENISWTSGSGESIPEVIVPVAPSALVATKGTSGINLSWTDNSNNETGFNIERSTAGGSFLLIGNTPANVTSYNDNNVLPGIQYTYRVQAYNNDTLSAYSPVTSFTIEIPSINAPTGLNATAGVKSVGLTWTDNSNNETGFKIERSASAGAYVVIATIAAGVTSYTDTTVSNGIPYSYKVQAYNNDTVSGYSNVVSITLIATGISNINSEQNGYLLNQNYPNPFNSGTTISFTLPKAENVVLSVLTINGKLIRVLANEHQSEGKHSIYFNADGLGNGTYIYKLKTESQSITKSMIILK